MDAPKICIVCGNEQVVQTAYFPLGSIPCGLCKRHKYHVVGYTFGPQAFENSKCEIFPPCMFLNPDC